ncbi:hydroxymethylglutaryl-CoA lyase [Fusobacterium varium]|nr:hydroxymethylglutaryl-CoA lyase [Fusobacterium varium]
MNLPKKVQIVEVGPRDGFQNIKTFIETKHKLEIIDSLEKAGCDKIEITSFVNPKWIPQMIDSKEVCETCVKKKDQKYEIIVLCPNKKGIENAVSSGAKVISVVISVSEAHNKANVNRSVAESFNELEEMVYKYPYIKFRLDLATVFGCPFGEEIKPERVSELIERAKKLGINEIMLADTVGLGNPALVENILKQVKKQVGTDGIILHIHDTRGMGLANMLIALQLGFSIFETSIGGLGGCPFAPGAAGNVATEDFVNMLNGMGIAHNIHLEKLYNSLDLINQYVNVKINNSHMYSVYKSKCSL